MTIPVDIKIGIIDKLAEIECRLASSGSEKINLGALIGSLKKIPDMMSDKNI